MRTEIKIGNQALDIECNNGTDYLFREFTGKSIREVMIEPALKIKDIERLKNITPGDVSALKVQEDLPTLSAASDEAIDAACKLAYVMHLQAINAKTADGISEIRKQLSRDHFILWMMNFEPKDFTMATYTELTAFWRKQSEGTSISKNA